MVARLAAFSFVLIALAGCEAPPPPSKAAPPQYLLDHVSEIGVAGGTSEACEGLIYDEALAMSETRKVAQRFRSDGFTQGDFNRFRRDIRQAGYGSLAEEYFRARGLEMEVSESSEPTKRELAEICRIGREEAQSGVGAGKYLTASTAAVE